MCSAVPRGGQLGTEKGRRYKLPIASKYLLCAGTTLVVKGLALASGNPGLTEEMAFLLLEGAWKE